MSILRDIEDVFALIGIFATVYAFSKAWRMWRPANPLRGNHVDDIDDHV